MTFGTRLRAARKLKGLTQVDVAGYFNIAPTTVSKWESDSSEPNQETLIKLAELCGVGVQYLLGGNSKTIFDYDLSDDEISEAIQYIKARRIMRMMNENID